MSVILLIGIGIYIYNFPYQRYQAEKIFEEYIHRQGLTNKDIKKRWTSKDFQQNGYIIRVVYKDDPDKIYEYHYAPSYSEKSTFKKMFLLVYEHGSSALSYKHKPL
ncbi:DUF3139 domain-containing protein [Neobacillus fumarioli]|uniref:DUF3139 domain-containing protein n=1 Tax=Neobacillus fumarioli TaxID=105229 RepID=UPI00350E5969